MVVAIKEKTKILPKLVELYTPCPICGGTTNTSSFSRVIKCESCGQEWDLLGNPIYFHDWLNELFC
jgi:transposase